MDVRAYRFHARLMRRRPAPAYEDALIAAVAIVNSLTVVTRNVADFDALGVALVDPFALR